MAVGRVIDEQRRPLEGVEVRVHTGLYTLWGGGKTTTNANGRYALQFSEGIFFTSDPANLQAASFVISKPGFREKSRSRPGILWMTRRLPARFGKHVISQSDWVILPNEPYEINFVMSPAE